MSDPTVVGELLISWAAKEANLIGEFSGRPEDYRELIEKTMEWADRLDIAFRGDMIPDYVWECAWMDDEDDEPLLEPPGVADYLRYAETPPKPAQGNVGPSPATSERSKGATQGFAAGGEAGPPGMKK